jgi:hypothetical protein
LHSALRGAFGGLIAKDQHHANDLAARIVNRCAGVSDGDFASIAREEQGVVRQSDDGAFAQHARHGVLHRRARLFVDDAEHLGEWFAARLGFAPAGQLFGDGIHSRHASLSIRGNDRIADAVEGGAQFRFALDERGVYFIAWGRAGWCRGFARASARGFGGWRHCFPSFRGNSARVVYRVGRHKSTCLSAYGWCKVGKLSLRAKREVSFALHERDFSAQNLSRA